MRPSVRVGDTFGKLTVIERVENSKGGKAKWKCVCSCGKLKTKPVTSNDLKSGKVVSCGCYYFVSNEGRNRTHGDSKARLWRIWCSMKNRCYCKSNREYFNYGGRGITVCEEWLHNYEAFKLWALSNGYSDELTVDRIDTDKGYSPENCRWATYKVQENNRRNTLRITIDGETLSASEWSDISGIKAATIIWRYKNGWHGSDILIIPNYNNKVLRRKKV